MSYMILPIKNDPNQTFQTTLSIDNTNLSLELFVRFSEIAKYWLIDITDVASDKVLLSSIPLVPGNDPAANLLHQYQHLKIGSLFLVKVGTSPEEYPGETTLATDWLVIWGDTT